MRVGFFDVLSSVDWAFCVVHLMLHENMVAAIGGAFNSTIRPCPEANTTLMRVQDGEEEGGEGQKRVRTLDSSEVS